MRKNIIGNVIFFFIISIILFVVGKFDNGIL